jgi:hypothetical protein
MGGSKMKNRNAIDDFRTLVDQPGLGSGAREAAKILILLQGVPRVLTMNDNIFSAIAKAILFQEKLIELRRPKQKQNNQKFWQLTKKGKKRLKSLAAKNI